VATRLRGLFRNALPLVFVSDASDAVGRRMLLTTAGALEVVDRQVDIAELADRIAAILRFKVGLLRLARGSGEWTSATVKDRLTGAYNKRFFLGLVDHEIRRAERYGGGFALVRARVRGLSRFKQRFGAPTADRLLVYTSVVLSKAMRESDALARIAEDEFALLLPGLAQEALGEVLGRIERRFQGPGLDIEGQKVRPEASLGAASFPDRLGSAPELLAAAKAGPGPGALPLLGPPSMTS
jgi:diguanylate cyclase (GGDEF)-like protein